MNNKELLEREIECSRHYLQALQLIAEMVGMDTSENPHQGVWDVVLAVEKFVVQSARHPGVSLDVARGRIAEHWIEEQRRREKPTPTVHTRAAQAYYAVLRGEVGRASPSPTQTPRDATT